MLWHGEVPVGARARTGLRKLICGELIRAYYEVTNVSITGDLSKAHLQYDVCMCLLQIGEAIIAGANRKKHVAVVGLASTARCVSFAHRSSPLDV